MCWTKSKTATDQWIIRRRKLRSRDVPFSDLKLQIWKFDLSTLRRQILQSLTEKKLQWRLIQPMGLAEPPAMWTNQCGFTELIEEHLEKMRSLAKKPKFQQACRANPASALITDDRCENLANWRKQTLSRRNLATSWIVTTTMVTAAIYSVRKKINESKGCLLWKS